MKTAIFLVLFLLCVIVSAHGQLQERDNLMGGTIGFWARNSAPTFGFNYENEITQTGIVAIGLGALARFSSYSNNHDERFSNVFLGGQLNFNFNQIESGKFVPFLGIVLGFYNSSPNGNSLKESGLWAWGQGGMRYFFSPNVAGVLRFGLGTFNYNALELGVDFKF